MMSSDAYPCFISSTLAYPASWHVSVPKVLLFISFLLLRIYLTGTCPCLSWSSAVQHVSVLRYDFLHTFPYVVPFGLTATHTATPLLIFAILVFFVFRSSFQFLGRSAAPSPAVPVITSSGRVSTIGVGDTVLLVEDVKYRVQKLFPSDGTVVLQRSTHETDHSNGSSASCGSHHPRPMML